jgi:ectoine hydroxylase-related dioxygenase (phytanoyl-CoA dioxygenase family)
MRQPVHKDNAYRHPQFPYFFIANVPLCDFNVENGATEFWLGSHAATSAADQVHATNEEQLGPYQNSRLEEPIPTVTESALEARGAYRPPMQPECSRGDIMIRDIRLWHAGMPNESNHHRIMLGLGYMVCPVSLLLTNVLSDLVPESTLSECLAALPFP